MTYLRKLFVLGAAMCATSAWAQAEYVNPFIGASTNTEQAGAYHGLGKTFPGATTPFGLVQVSPQTITGGDNGPGYSYEHQTIEGFSMTQMSGIGWYGDLGNFTVMPTTGGLKTIAGKEDGTLGGWRSRYSKDSETAHAGYYSVSLTDYGIRTETTASTHCGLLRFTFPEHAQSRIQIDLARRVGGTASRQSITVVDAHTLEGWIQCTPDGGGWGDGAGKGRYTIYFHATLDKPLVNYGFWKADIPEGTNRHRESVCSHAYQARIAQSEILRGQRSLEGDHIGFFTEFPTSHCEQVEMKVGISFVDLEGARKNYQAEVADKDFNQVRALATKSWNKALSSISIEGGTAEEKTIFYTALYHTLIDPRIYQDVDGRYVGGDYQIHQAEEGFTKRTIFSGWDVFRSQFPLQTLINPRMVSDMINSLMGMAEQSGNGYLERWELMNAYSGCMLGNPAISVITDAYAKGIRTFDTEKALTLCLNTAQRFDNNEQGFTPGSVSHSLEYAYNDWCLAQLARMQGNREIAKEYKLKAQNYSAIYDASVHSFRPRKADGSWETWPEDGWLHEGYGSMECNPLQQGWFVPHDVKGMAKLMGGKKQALADLDMMFQHTPEDMLWNQYYNHANEPVHHVPYLYNRLGQPWKTQYWTRFILEHAYANDVAGLKGNEDVGQMSAWYVLSAAGIHPVCPGDPRMEITAPLFEKVTFTLDPNYASGKEFTIISHNNSPENVYIQSAKLNGRTLKQCYLDFAQIANGGTLELQMGPEPNQKWGK